MYFIRPFPREVAGSMGKGREDVLRHQAGKICYATQAISMALVLGICFFVSASTQDSADVAVVMESFQRLAVMDPDIAGAVWMSDSAYDSWHELLREMDKQASASSLWFVHTLPLTAVSDGGLPYGGIYSPWLGILLVFELDESASTITGFSLEYIADPISAGSDPVNLAVELMDSIGIGAEAFDSTVGLFLEADTGRAERRALAERVGRFAKPLDSMYEADTAKAQLIAGILESMLTGEFPGHLSLLETQDEAWIAGLTPISSADYADQLVVVLASSVEPYDLVWLEIADDESGAPRRVTLIQLFESVTTRGSDGI